MCVYIYMLVCPYLRNSWAKVCTFIYIYIYMCVCLCVPTPATIKIFLRHDFLVFHRLDFCLSEHIIPGAANDGSPDLADGACVCGTRADDREGPGATLCVCVCVCVCVFVCVKGEFMSE